MKGIVLAASSRQIGDYTTTEIIGRGGYGSVYRAADTAHGRDVAIKVLDGELDEARRRRFDRERQTMGRLSSHPNIVSVYDSGYTEADEAFIVMELAAGGSLRDRLRQQGPLPWKEATTIIVAIAKAAQAAHDAGVFHRDIKPDNILIDHFNNPKLADFGIASVATNATATTTTTATLAHAAPEVLQGQASSPAVDIYALGSTLFALISGRPPFLQSDEDTIASMIGRALTQPPPDIRTFGVPDHVARVIEKSLAKDASGRQPTAAHLADELSEAIGDTGGAVRSSGASTDATQGNRAHETRLATPNPSTPPRAPGRSNEPAGLWMTPEPPGQYQAPYQATPPPQWNPPHEAPAYQSGQISGRPKWLWPLLATGAAVLAASALYVSGVGRSTGTANDDTQANANNNEPSGEDRKSVV